MSRKELARSIIEDIVRVAREIGSIPSQRTYLESGKNKFKYATIKTAFSSWTTALKAAGLTANIQLERRAPEERREPKILIFDIETAPILGYVWGLWEQNVGINQIKSDWHLLSWAAKWFGDPPSKIMYMDQRRAKLVEDDKNIMAGLWKLLDEADVVITQNGKAFDAKKVNARFVLNGMTPPSPYKHIDTLQLAKKSFAFSSNKLEYMSEKLCVKYKKLKSKEYAGFDLWKACLAGDVKAWREMEKYNKHDVLATEELYTKLAPWGVGVDLNVFHSESTCRCNCGSSDLIKKGFTYSKTGKYQQFQCKSCGCWLSTRGEGNNLLSKAKKSSLKLPREG